MANMDLMAFLSTFVLVATIATTIFAVGAYVVSRGYVRKRKSIAKAPLGGPAAAAPQPKAQKPILRRYVP